MSVYSQIILTILLILFTPIIACAEDTSSYEKQREDMVYMLTKGIFGRTPVRNTTVLESMQRVLRHEFVPESIRKDAYADTPLPIGNDQTISQPYIVARMTELLELKSGDSVLEIGTGSGYQAAVLAEICNEVFTIEIVESLAKRAQSTLDRLGYNNIRFRIGDGYKGWPDEAPFDAIIVTAAPNHVPQPLIDQLKPGGRMVIPVGQQHRVQKLQVITKQPDGNTSSKTVDEVRFVPLTRETIKP